jgi:uncharacterized OsmC-like protein
MANAMSSGPAVIMTACPDVTLPIAGQEGVTVTERGVVVVTESDARPYGQRIIVGEHELTSDEPSTIGGADSGPTPYDLLLAGLGACTAVTLRMYAERKSWDLRHVTVRLRHDRIHARDCVDCETSVGWLDHIQREVQLEGDLTDEQRARLLAIAEHCPVHRTLHSEVVISTVGSTPDETAQP